MVAEQGDRHNTGESFSKTVITKIMTNIYFWLFLPNLIFFLIKIGIIDNGLTYIVFFNQSTNKKPQKWSQPFF